GGGVAVDRQRLDLVREVVEIGPREPRARDAPARDLITPRGQLALDEQPEILTERRRAEHDRVERSRFDDERRVLRARVVEPHEGRAEGEGSRPAATKKGSRHRSKKATRLNSSHV